MDQRLPRVHAIRIHADADWATRINRKDFGLGWNQLLETGGVAVGDEVKISIDAEVVATPE